MSTEAVYKTGQLAVLRVQRTDGKGIVWENLILALWDDGNWRDPNWPADVLDDNDVVIALWPLDIAQEEYGR